MARPWLPLNLDATRTSRMVGRIPSGRRWPGWAGSLYSRVCSTGMLLSGSRSWNARTSPVNSFASVATVSGRGWRPQPAVGFWRPAVQRAASACLRDPILRTASPAIGTSWRPGSKRWSCGAIFFASLRAAG